MACDGNWHPPKTDWHPSNQQGITGEDLNLIGCDLQYLYAELNGSVAEASVEVRVAGVKCNYGSVPVTLFHKIGKNVTLSQDRALSFRNLNSGVIELFLGDNLPWDLLPNSNSVSIIMSLRWDKAGGVLDMFVIGQLVQTSVVSNVSWSGKIIINRLQQTKQLLELSSATTGVSDISSFTMLYRSLV